MGKQHLHEKIGSDLYPRFPVRNVKIYITFMYFCFKTFQNTLMAYLIDEKIERKKRERSKAVFFSEDEQMEFCAPRLSISPSSSKQKYKPTELTITRD